MCCAAANLEGLPERRRTRRGEERRLQILEQATRLFLARGYDAVSIGDILDAAGGSKTNVYTFFGDKDGLFLAAMNALISELLEPLASLDVANRSLKEGLTEVGSTLLRILLKPRHIAYQRLVIAESARYPVVGREWYSHGPRQTRLLIAGLITHHQREGRVRADVDPGIAAVLYHDMITFDLLLRTTLQISPAPAEAEIEARVTQAVSFFLPGLMPASSPPFPGSQ
jgi:AcrR family transcriptional regulator